MAALLPALLFVAAGYERRWAGDDGLINLRVVRQLMAGNGFVYNAGERTEAVTSAAWVLVLWLVGELGLDLETSAWVLSLSLSMVGLFAAARASARLWAQDGETRAVVVPLGVLAYAAIPVAWDYATSALENGLGLGFLGSMYWLMVRATTSATTRGQRAIAAFCGLAPLVRPDFALYAAPMVLILIAMTQGFRARASVALAAALPGAAYEIFRMGYFACLVPNTALAKEAFETRWDRGLIFFENTYTTYLLIVPTVCCALSLVVLSRRLLRGQNVRPAWVPTAFACVGVLHILYVVRLGGDFMHGRMLLPGLFACFASAGVQMVRLTPSPVPRQAGTRARVAAWFGSSLAISSALVLTVACWAAYCAAYLRVEQFPPNIQDERGNYVESSGHAHPTRVAHYINHPYYWAPLNVRTRIAAGCPSGDRAMGDQAREPCPGFALPDASDGVLSDWTPGVLVPLDPSSTAPFVLGVIGFRPLGIAGLAVGLRTNIVDSFGLADSVASRMVMGERGRAGHEKFFTTPWFHGKFGAEGSSADARAVTAKRVLRCGLLGALHAATHEPMSVSRFARNMGLAWPLHKLRIPVDPAEAERLFCQHEP